MNELSLSRLDELIDAIEAENKEYEKQGYKTFVIPGVGLVVARSFDEFMHQAQEYIKNNKKGS